MTEQRAHFRQVDPHFPDAAFADVINANHEYVKDFQDSHLTGRAAKELAVVTCMDSRIEPLRMLGLRRRRSDLRRQDRKPQPAGLLDIDPISVEVGSASHDEVLAGRNLASHQ